MGGPVPGSRGQAEARLFDRKVDAERFIATTTADMMRGTYLDPAAGKVTLAAFAATWSARMGPTWRISTAAGVANSLDTHILPVLGRRPVAAIRESDVEALCASLALAPSTVATVHQHLGQLFAGAVEDVLIARNPATRARLPKREPSKAQPVPLEVVERIHAALPDWMGGRRAHRHGRRATTGRGQRAYRRPPGLPPANAAGRSPARQPVRPAPVLGRPKTDSSHRTIPLAGFLLDARADHLRRFPAGPGELVLRSPTGLPLDSDRFGHQWRRACRSAGVPGLGYHSLRHTFASTLLSRGVSVKAVADWLGHASPMITLATYAHLMPADEEVARTVLDAALAPPGAAIDHQAAQ